MKKLLHILKRIFFFLFPSYWRQRKQMKLLATIAESVAYINTLKKKGVIYWQPKQRQYIIEQVVADAHLTSRENWEGFMKMLTYAAIDERTIEARKWAEIEARRKAVNAANREHPSLTRADIERIERQAVAELPPAEFQTIEEFDFAVVRQTARKVSEATEANGQLVIVGHYDIDGKLELALWEDVKHNFQKKEGE